MQKNLDHQWQSVRYYGVRQYGSIKTEISLFECRRCKAQKEAPTQTGPRLDGCK